MLQINVHLHAVFLILLKRLTDREKDLDQSWLIRDSSTIQTSIFRLPKPFDRGNTTR